MQGCDSPPDVNLEGMMDKFLIPCRVFYLQVWEQPCCTDHMVYDRRVLLFPVIHIGQQAYQKISSGYLVLLRKKFIDFMTDGKSVHQLCPL